MRRSLIGLALSLALAACSSSAPTHYYALSGLNGPSAAPPAGAKTLAVVPVKIPEYLNHLEIVTRDSQEGLVLASYDQWGEPLDFGVTRVVAGNLAVLFQGEHVAITNVAPSLADFALWVQLRRFEVDAAGTCTLAASWSLAKGNPDRPIVRGDATISEPAAGTGYPADIAAMNRALEALTRRIAATLQGHVP